VFIVIYSAVFSNSIFSCSYLFKASTNITKRMVEPIRKVSGRILISKAFNPSISAGFGPRGA